MMWILLNHTSKEHYSDRLQRRLHHFEREQLCLLSLADQYDKKKGVMTFDNFSQFAA